MLLICCRLISVMVMPPLFGLLVIYSCIDLASPGSTTVLFSSVGAEGSLHADSCVFIALG